MNTKDILNQIEKKPIFVCSEQTITFHGKHYDGIPKCEYVKIEWDDWLKLRDSILS